MSLEKYQSVCPKCARSHISVYSLLNENLKIEHIEGFCPKCGHKWVIAIKESFE